MSVIPRDGGEGSTFGRYRLVRELGRGGMGVVYRAVSEGPQGFSRSCVIKRIVPHLSSDDAFIRSLIAEARVSGLLSHPGIVQVLEFGEVNGEYFLALEYVDGLSLLQVTRRCEPTGRVVPPGVACFLIKELAVALGYAHALTDDDGRPLSIVHRDVSPSNVMLGRSGAVKLLDFGIARAAAHMRDSQTRTGTLKGKFAYMSPEQAEGLPIDGRSDLFALGVLLWEALTQKRLFYAADDLQTLRMVREAKVQRTGIDAQLDGVLLKALAKNPNDRFANGDELAAALLPIAHRLEGNVFSLKRFVAEVLDLPDPQAGARPPTPSSRTPRDQPTQNLSRPHHKPTPAIAPKLERRAEARPEAKSDSAPGADAPRPGTSYAFTTDTPLTAPDGYDIKGSLVRAYTQQISELGLLEQVLSMVRPETRRLMTELPLSNTWIDASVIEDMINQVEKLKGIDAVRTVTKAGIHSSILPILKPAVMPLLRLFGASPHTLLSRFGKFTKNNVRGLEFEWTHDADRAGTLRVSFPRRTPRSAFAGFEAAIRISCELCGTQAKIDEVEMSADQTWGVLRARW